MAVLVSICSMDLLQLIIPDINRILEFLVVYSAGSDSAFSTFVIPAHHRLLLPNNSISFHSESHCG